MNRGTYLDPTSHYDKEKAELGIKHCLEFIDKLQSSYK